MFVETREKTICLKLSNIKLWGLFLQNFGFVWTILVVAELLLQNFEEMNLGRKMIDHWRCESCSELRHDSCVELLKHKGDGWQRNYTYCKDKPDCYQKALKAIQKLEEILKK